MSERMRTETFTSFCVTSAFSILFGQVSLAGQSMSMPGVENSVGYQSSGTSIEPTVTSESAPMIHRSLGNWTVMFHANAFMVSLQQKGNRGTDKVFSTNWVMPMAVRQFGRHSLMFRTMLSAEPATVTNRKYPLLFQTGETAYGLSIIDAQHPHDFVMELAAKYDFKIGERSQLFVYGGPVGEPALGPAAFPHRSSASENPLAVLGHHSQDSTHLSNNVITLGMTAGPVQLEASTFHGREPNENRWNIDKGKPDSFASRITIAPRKSLSGQFSIGRINQPEAIDPALDVIRTTASIHHNVRFASGHVSSSLIFGRNKDVKNGSPRIFDSYNLEITTKFRNKNWVWTRIENLDRDRSLVASQKAPAPPTCLLCGLLGLPPVSPVQQLEGKSREFSRIDDQPFKNDHIVLGPEGTPIVVEEIPIGRIQAYTLGYERELPLKLSSLNVGLGVQATAYGVGPAFKSVYGSRSGTLAIFLRIRPAGNMMDHMRQMHQH